MASTQTWSEYNGTNAATETASRAECNWKAVDDSTTSYASSPITAGTNSFSKYQAIKFAGTWNSLSAFTYKVSTTSPGTGLTVVGSVVTSGTTPTTTATGDGTTNMTTGISANFVSNSTPYGAGTSSSTASGTMYVNPFRTQLQTTVSAGAGDISTVTITASWTES
ncbi:hypothetical protein HGB25_00275 [Candidatus Saccharibacteria bacterium]|nr:hypothetical protein [Candidatus Saccharibacteria bacterium]